MSERAVELGATARQRSWWADAGFQAFDREMIHGGGLLAGGLAYRLFLWLLPIGLVGAELLGLWFDLNDDSVEGGTSTGTRKTGFATPTQAIGTALETLRNRFETVLVVMFI